MPDTQNPTIKFLDYVFELPPLRTGPEFWDGYSDSLLCLDLLLNQRVGVERATAAAMSLHYHFGKPRIQFSGSISESTGWPYRGISLRGPAKSLHNLITNQLKNHGLNDNVCISQLPAGVVGALASLERYYNRTAEVFNALQNIEIDSDALRTLSLENFRDITLLNFPNSTLPKQLKTAATLLDMKRSNIRPNRKELLSLERVGNEAADTLLVFFFYQPSVIDSDYLRRIFYRHFLIESPKVTRRFLTKTLEPLVNTYEKAHLLHARLTDAGVLYCFSSKPDCSRCPLHAYPHRSE